MKKDLIILFCRYPVPNRTKTRLIPDIGPVGAAELHHKFVLRALQTIDRAAKRYGYDIEVCFDGTSTKKASKWLGTSRVYSVQKGEGLGEKLDSAFNETFMKGYKRIVLIGTDIPGLTLGHIKHAFETLHHEDLVLGPSNDGGYWLVGMRKYSNIFTVDNWGGSNVLEQTIMLAGDNGLSFELLEYLSDIDTFEDLRTWKPGENWKKPYLSVVIPTLDEAGTIEATIKRSSDPEVEIIVADGGSKDRTTIIAENAGAKIVKTAPGRALQLNKGAEEAKAGVLLFLHSDTMLPEGYPSLIFDSLLDRSVACGAFRFKTDMDTPFMRLIEFFTNIRSEYFRLPYGDQALFVPKHVFNRIGGFPVVPIAEDLLFVKLLSKEGKIVVSPANIITSARRWRDRGIFRIWINNLVILFGILIGLPPKKFSKLRR